MDELGGSGIVYAATHAGAESARDVLAPSGSERRCTTPGSAPPRGAEAMEEFLDGSARIIAATVAFGMGIDKPDVRWVLHADAPVRWTPTTRSSGAPDATARRRGAAPVPAGRHRHGPPPDRAAVSDAVVGAVGGARRGRDLGDSARARRPLALAPLVDVGAAAGRRRRSVGAGRPDVAGAQDASRESPSASEEVERSRMEMMRRYAETTAAGARSCCRPSARTTPVRAATATTTAAAAEPPPAVEPFALGGRVASERWGEGTVQRYDGDQLTVLFDDHGYRDLLVPLVVSAGCCARVRVP